MMGIATNNQLKGWFLECCDCFTICPCWVSERPDEDHCSALYVWTFSEGATIEGHDISHKSIVAATFHSGSSPEKPAETAAENDEPDLFGLIDRFLFDPEEQEEEDNGPPPASNKQAAIYVDATLDKATQQLLLDAFSGKTIARLKSLERLMGTVVHSGPARITHSKSNGQWEVTVEVNGSRIAHANGLEEPLEGRSKPISLYDTALHDELGIEASEAAVVQKVARFELAVSPLPIAPFVYSGRSGLAAKFNYSGRS